MQAKQYTAVIGPVPDPTGTPLRQDCRVPVLAHYRSYIGMPCRQNSRRPQSVRYQILKGTPLRQEYGVPVLAHYRSHIGLPCRQNSTQPELVQCRSFKGKPLWQGCTEPYWARTVSVMANHVDKTIHSLNRSGT